MSWNYPKWIKYAWAELVLVPGIMEQLNIKNLPWSGSEIHYCRHKITKQTSLSSKYLCIICNMLFKYKYFYTSLVGVIVHLLCNVSGRFCYWVFVIDDVFWVLLWMLWQCDSLYAFLSGLYNAAYFNEMCKCVCSTGCRHRLKMHKRWGKGEGC